MRGFVAGAAAVMWMLAGIQMAAAAPQRIVSINLCTDQILLDLDPGQRLVAVSELARDPSLSPAWQRAQDVPVTPASLEHVVGFEPDLVVAGSFGHTRLLRQAEAMGIDVLRVREATSFEDVRTAYRAVGEAVGLTARAAALVGEIDRLLEAPAPARGTTALMLSPGLMAHDDAMPGGAVLRHAGFANIAGAAAYLSLEALAAAPADRIFLALGDAPAPSRAVRLFAHPALAGLDVSRVPPAPLMCGSLATAQLARALASDGGQGR